MSISLQNGEQLSVLLLGKVKIWWFLPVIELWLCHYAFINNFES